MARHNTTTLRTTGLGPVTSTGLSGATYEGAPGYGRHPKSELFLAAVSSLNEDTFYESSTDLMARIRPLIAAVAVQDGPWVLGFVAWLRVTAKLRSIPLAIAAEAVHARLDAGVVGLNRALVSAAILRADEPAEFLAYWRGTFGRTTPAPVKRGLSDALERTLSERSWLKWRGKGERGGMSLADVVNIVHPHPADEHRAALFGAILAHSYGRPVESLGLLPVVAARQEFLGLDAGAQRSFALGPDAPVRLAAAGLGHEALAGALGRLDSAVWESLIPGMGYQALLMNLRRIHEAGVSRKTVKAIKSRLSDPAEVARSRMYPIRFLSAFRNAPLEYAGALENAANLTLGNIPELPGRTLVLVDRSGSMWSRLSARGELLRVDAANMFGAALALKAERADLVAFGTDSRKIPFRRGTSLLRLADQSESLGGTETRKAVERHYRGHNRVIVITDEQAGWQGTTDVFSGTVPENVPAFTWNLAGYRHGHAPEGPNRYTFGGLSDAGFDLIPLLERGLSAGWPWDA
ncbi:MULTISPECIES: TROVE domain-containing protein [Arthrobacter]|uniref:TROVE domain-containing protein n=2 Tax=Arthrobacter TaxID=1663 RepID=A0ABU9KJ09_9MICC|nr:TROVE domain-containing protein [Arthrobacter sp. YJM1]MDP5226611.1 TROVE domain-containing protein [Arthrobacter sp. YJM1]